MISFVSSADILTLSHRFLSVADDGTISTEYLAAAVRRLAGATCPCSPKTLLKVMVDSHRGLFSETDVFADRVESVIDDLVSVGDLLELSDVSTVDERIKGTWLFAAPPGFVIHHGGVAHIIGISSDEQTPLPAAIRDRVIVEGVTRRIAPNPPEDLGSLLSALGLREIPGTVWMSHPRRCSARELIVRADGRLSSSTRLGEEDGVRVFDHRSNSRSYRRCWEPLASQHGKFIIRRPQAYGADRWGYAEIANGGVANVFEFPEPGDRARGCDIAWRMMAALKALQGEPIRYRSMDSGDMSAFDFFFPVPDWARRSLRFSGREVVSRDCLLSFDVPVGSANAIHRFLNDMLFFEQQSD